MKITITFEDVDSEELPVQMRVDSNWNEGEPTPAILTGMAAVKMLHAVIGSEMHELNA